MRETLSKLKLFFFALILIILPITQFIFYLFSSTINGIEFYYTSLFLVFFLILFIPNNQLRMTLKHKTSEFFITCFSIVSFLTLVLLGVNYFFSGKKVDSLSFKIVHKGTKFIRSTSQYKYVRLLNNSYTCDYYVTKTDFDRLELNTSIRVILRKGFLDFLIIENIPTFEEI